MQLTALQREIQERSDKTISEGLIVLHSQCEEYGIGHDEFALVWKVGTIAKNGDPTNMERNFHTKTFLNGTYGFDTPTIIGHPMTYGRLCYLNDSRKITKDIKEQNNLRILLEKGFQKELDSLQRTVLEWSESLCENVLAFLKSLPEGTKTSHP